MRYLWMNRTGFPGRLRKKCLAIELTFYNLPCYNLRHYESSWIFHEYFFRSQLCFTLRLSFHASSCQTANQIALEHHIQNDDRQSTHDRRPHQLSIQRQRSTFLRGRTENL